MSYGIVRVQKFKVGSVKGIEIHDRREKNEISHTNKEIDWTKTKNNYDLHRLEGTFRQNIKNRIADLNLKKAVRKDAVVMAQCLVTSDKSFFKTLNQEEQKEFFKDSYEFLKNRYGERNVISATVHLDETTPHMHFNFVPVTDQDRLSAKIVLNRMDLIKQQDEFHKSVGEKYGLKRGEKGGYKQHLEVAEYKKQSAFSEVEKIENKIQEMKNEKNSLEKDLNALKIDLDSKKDIKACLKKIDDINAKYGFIDKNKVTIDSNDFENLKEMGKRHQVLENELFLTKKQNKSLEKDLNTLKPKLYKDFEEIKELKNKLKINHRLLNHLADYLKQNGHYDKACDYLDVQKEKEQKEKAIKKSMAKKQQDHDIER